MNHRVRLSSRHDRHAPREKGNIQRPFLLKGVDRTLPAGEYEVVTDEELIEGLSFPVYRRLATMMYVPAQSHRASSIEMVTLDPAALQAAQDRDAKAVTMPDEFMQPSSRDMLMIRLGELSTRDPASLTVLNVRHTTVYRYSRPVRLGDHRLMLRPRDSHDLRLIQTSLNISPTASVRWLHDVFGNSIAIASFDEPSTELRIESNLRLETYLVKRPAFQITPEAVSYPFIYSADDRIDLGRMLERHNPDPSDRLGSWARASSAAIRPIRWRCWPTSTAASGRLSDIRAGKPRAPRPRSRPSIAAGARAATSRCC